MSDDMFDFEEKSYYEKFENRICLSVMSPDPANRDAGILVHRREESISLPYRSLRKGCKSRDIAEQLLNDITGVDCRPWATVQQIGFIDTNADYQIVLYSAMLPQPIAPKVGGYEWFNYNRLLDHHMANLDKRPTVFDLVMFASHTNQIGFYP